MTVTPSTLLVLGASGDLTNRLLLPAIGQLLTSPEGPPTLQIVGAGMEQWTDEFWGDRVKAAFDSVKASGARVDDILAHPKYLPADVTQPADLQKLVQACDGAPAIYFALPPAITAKACQALAQVSLPEGTALVLEKPFGTDRDSAVALNTSIRNLVPENQIHRVDHFLGKSTVVNILGLRFANRIFEPLWNSDHVERVDIVFDETLGLEDRARYYDKAGALVDMIQSHLLQVMALVAMDPPGTMNAEDIRGRKADALRATKVWGDSPEKSTRRARYTAGSVGDRAMGAYADSAGVDPSLNTETLAEVTLEVDNWRWAGVPFRLRSGKALGDKRQEIIVTFKPVPRVVTGLYGRAKPSRLRISMGVNRIGVDLNVNGPGDPYTLDSTELVCDFGPGRLPAYGEVLAGVFDGDPSLSVRADTAEDCWRIVDDVLASWKAGEVPLEEYPAGSKGPKGWPI